MSSQIGKPNATLLGVALLRISPLVLSSASLIFSWAQHISLGAFLHHSLRNGPTRPSGKILPHYLPAFMKPGIWGIGLTYIPATIICIVNAVSGQSRATCQMYFAGGLLSIAQFSWGPSMFVILRRIQDPKTAGLPNEKALELWLSKHHHRTYLVNEPAFLVILAATLATITEGLK